MFSTNSALHVVLCMYVALCVCPPDNLCAPCHPTLWFEVVPRKQLPCASMTVLLHVINTK